MKAIIIVTFVALIKLSEGHRNCTKDFNLTPENKQAFLNAWKNEDNFQRHIKYIESSSNNVNLKCYINCVYEHLGLIANGEIHIGVKSKIAKHADKCETAFNIYKLEKLPLLLPSEEQLIATITKCLDDNKIDILGYMFSKKAFTDYTKKCLYKCILVSAGLMENGRLNENYISFDYKKYDDDCDTANEIMVGFEKLQYKILEVI